MLIRHSERSRSPLCDAFHTARVSVRSESHSKHARDEDERLINDNVESLSRAIN